MGSGSVIMLFVVVRSLKIEEDNQIIWSTTSMRLVRVLVSHHSIVELLMMLSWMLNHHKVLYVEYLWHVIMTKIVKYTCASNVSLNCQASSKQQAASLQTKPARKTTKTYNNAIIIHHDEHTLMLLMVVPST